MMKFLFVKILFCKREALKDEGWLVGLMWYYCGLDVIQRAGLDRLGAVGPCGRRDRISASAAQTSPSLSPNNPEPLHLAR